MFQGIMIIKTILNRNARVINLSLNNQIRFTSYMCKLLVVGGGTGGCAVAAKFAKKIIGKGETIVVEPSTTHYYQPMFTLVGGGIKKLEECRKPTEEVLPNSVKWIRDHVIKFNPKTDTVVTANGHLITYEFLLIAVGLQLHYEKIPGLVEALNTPKSGVCSNYSPNYVEKTFESLQNFTSGNALFTYPNTPVKCPGAPQKICYITEHFLRKQGKRKTANVIYNTSLPVIFGVKKYADALWKVVKKRDINVNLRTNLIEVQPDKKFAIFENLDNPDQKLLLKYNMLHVTPPMSPPDVLLHSQDITTPLGFVDVNKDTLQHVKYPNIFALGDCSSTPNSKTAASVAAQSDVVYKNLLQVMKGKQPTSKYNGYASCPLVTGYGTCILAEFDYDLNPLETFPISQDKESWIMYAMKKDVMPPLYWHFMMNGYWNGPGLVRKVMHLNFKN